jgi:putative tryptophan/tyrosine transport system substrate-binding protein
MRFIAGLGGAASWPLVARAQQPAMSVVGVLDSGSPDGMEANLVALRRGLGEAGFTEAKTSPSNIAGRVARAIKALADELVRKPVAVIVATRSSATGLLRALLWVPAALYCAPPSRWAGQV